MKRRPVSDPIWWNDPEGLRGKAAEYDQIGLNSPSGKLRFLWQEKGRLMRQRAKMIEDARRECA